MNNNTLAKLVVFLTCTGATLLSCGSPATLGPQSSGGSSNRGGGGNAGNGGNGVVGDGGHGGQVIVTLEPSGGSRPGAGGSAAGSTSTAPGGNCGTTTQETKRAITDVLIVLDRSSSMTWSMTEDNVTCTARDPSCSARLAAVVTGVSGVVTNSPDIYWGLELFTSPNATSCTVNSKPQVEIGPNKGDAIKTQLAALTTSSSTPTAAAINVGTAYLKTVNDGNNKVILLATDGEPNCGGGSSSTSDLPGATDAVKAAKAAGYPVYVIGIGPSVSNLNVLAQEGGTDKYYPATSTDDLNKALNAIAKVVSGTCSYKADTSPPDKNLVYVYVDKHLVEQDATNGWVFESADTTGSTIKLTGSYCDGMLSGTTTQVQIVFGCPNVIPTQVIP